MGDSASLFVLNPVHDSPWAWREIFCLFPKSWSTLPLLGPLCLCRVERLNSGIVKGGFGQGELVIGPMVVPGGSLTVPSAYCKVRSQPPHFANSPFNNH